MAGATLEGAVSGPLAPALAVSIALHAAALAGLPDLWTFSEAPSPLPLTAWLVPGAAPQSAAEPPRVDVAATAPRPRTARPANPALTVPKTAPDVGRDVPATPPAPREATSPERTNVAASAPTAGPGEAVSAPAEASGAAPALGGETPTDVGSLAQYRMALISAASRHKPYPSRAIDRGWQGRVVLRLVIGADGGLAHALVQRSSGHEVLDRQALEMFRRAHAQTPLPPALRNREFPLEVAVAYELKDAR